MQSKQLVVAKYREDVSWLSQVNIPTIVYDKCPEVRPDIELPHVEFVESPNIRNGREAHSYLSHIVQNYDNLADVTFFVQGDPFVHSPRLWERLELDYSDTASLSVQYSEGHPSLEVKEKDTVIMHEGIVSRYGNAYTYTNNPHYHNKRWLEMIWMKLFPAHALPKQFLYGYGAQWAVPRRRIVHRSQLFYDYCFREISSESSIMTAWAFEVLWYYIFQNNKKYKDIYTYINNYCHLPLRDRQFPCMY
jgi:hypothetical protein